MLIEIWASGTRGPPVKQLGGVMSGLPGPYIGEPVINIFSSRERLSIMLFLHSHELFFNTVADRVCSRGRTCWDRLI